MGDQGDLTRKQRREHARAARKEAEEAASLDAARRRRLTQLGGVVATVAVAIVVILIVTSGGSSKPPKAGSSTANAEVAAVTSLLAGTPQSGNVLGSPTAPVTMQYFGDLECPICADFTRGALPSIIQKWVKSGKLKIEYRSFETATGGAEHEGAEPEGTFNKQQLAALAAGKQNKAWDYIELFYHEQGAEGSGYVTESYMQGLAQQVPGLNLEKWTADRGDQALSSLMATDTQVFNNNGFKGTPAFLIGKTGDRLSKYEYTSLTEASGFEEQFEKAQRS